MLPSSPVATASRHRLPARVGLALLLAVLASGGIDARAAFAQGVVAPKALSQPAASWPDGKVETHDIVIPVTLTIAADGTVIEAVIEASLGEELDRAAIAAARTWRFEPATAGDKQVSAKVRALVRFIGAPSVAQPAAIMKPSEATESPGARVPLPPPAAAAAGATAEPAEVQIRGERVAPPRSASEITLKHDVIQAAPHRTGGDLLQIVPGVFITQHSGQGKAYQVFYRGFDAVHGQDLEFWVGGAPVNEVSNIHGQGYSDLHFVMPEVVSAIHVLPGNYSPDQGDFAVAGTIRYDLGYDEPGVTAKGTLGSFGERRVFMAYHPEGESPGSFAAFEAQSTDGFGPSRAASRTSGIAQHVVPVGEARLRVLATAYAARFDSPGVVRLSDIEERRIGRFDTYGTGQGGFSSRYQLVMDLSGGSDGSDWSIAPYAILRDLRLKQNYTGFLVHTTDGDTTQQTNESSTLGLTGRYRRKIRIVSPSDSVEAGVSLRNDWISQSELDLGSIDERVLSTVVNAKIRAMDAAGWVDVMVQPISQLKVRAGVRVDGLAYGIEDDASPTDTRPGSTDSTNFSSQLRPPSPGGQARAAMGTHVGPRITVDGTIAEGIHAVGSYGEGFRSPQARSLGDGEKTPFTTVRSLEAGVRFATGIATGSVAAFRTTLSNDSGVRSSDHAQRGGSGFSAARRRARVWASAHRLALVERQRDLDPSDVHRFGWDVQLGRQTPLCSGAHRSAGSRVHADARSRARARSQGEARLGADRYVRLAAAVRPVRPRCFSGRRACGGAAQRGCARTGRVQRARPALVRQRVHVQRELESGRGGEPRAGALRHGRRTAHGARDAEPVCGLDGDDPKKDLRHNQNNSEEDMKRGNAACLAVVGALAWGCSSSSSDTSGTTGKTVTLSTKIDIQGDLTQPKTNALGWTVTVSKAYLSVGALYFFQGDPVLSLRDRQTGHERRSFASRLSDLLERPAYAHPGHYIPGQAMGQMITPTTVDLLGGSVVLAGGTGITGIVNSGRFTWQSPPGGDKAALLAGHVVLAEGVATKGAASVHFVAKADQADVVDGNSLPEVDGCMFGTTPGQVGADVESDGTVTLTLVPSVWFDEVDFSYVLPGASADAGSDAASDDAGTEAGTAADAGDSVIDIGGTLAWQGFLRGVKKGTAYLFSFSK